MINIYIDATEFQRDINVLRRNMSQEQFERAMYGIMRRTSRHVSLILRKDLPKEYEAKPGRIGAAVKRPKVSAGAGGVGCSIPIKDRRGEIGNVYRASGGRHGWASLDGKVYRVKARIVKRGQSTLPQDIDGFKPFRNLGSRLGKNTFVRTSKKRLPIKKVMGVSIPQMPMNRSEKDVQQDIKVYLEKQIASRIQAMMVGR